MKDREVWDDIADSWYRLRHYTRFRPELEGVAGRWQGGRLLNLGCAHGPDFLPFRQGFELWGVDFSRHMLSLGMKYSAQFGFQAHLLQADACHLPFRDESFDYAIAIAVYHHIRGGEGRRGALRELYRVLRPGGEAFLTFWNRWQPRFWLRGQEAHLPWHSGGQTFYRYYHLFSYGEAEKLLNRAGLEVLSLSPEQGHHLPLKALSRNICALVRKGLPQQHQPSAGDGQGRAHSGAPPYPLPQEDQS